MRWLDGGRLLNWACWGVLALSVLSVLMLWGYPALWEM